MIFRFGVPARLKKLKNRAVGVNVVLLVNDFGRDDAELNRIT